MSRFRAWTAEHYSPLVLVIASPEAEAVAARSGLSVVDLLAPHCHVRLNGASLPAHARSHRRPPLRRCRWHHRHAPTLAVVGSGARYAHGFKLRAAP
jgi:hypothetical protein